MRSVLSALIVVLWLTGCVDVGAKADTRMLGDSDLGKLLREHWYESESAITSLVRSRLLEVLASDDATASWKSSVEKLGFSCDALQESRGQAECRYEGSVLMQMTK